MGLNFPKTWLVKFWKLKKDGIKTFYSGIKSCIHVIQNGITSDYFFPQRGCRECDPISQYLFLLYVEVLGILIRNNKDKTGIIDGDVEFKLSQY